METLIDLSGILMLCLFLCLWDIGDLIKEKTLDLQLRNEEKKLEIEERRKRLGDKQ